MQFCYWTIWFEIAIAAAVAALAVVVALAGELDSYRLDLVVIHQDI